ncbi:hypothetical protein HMPREF1868_00775 [Olsenella sp. DNF00959]|nr:hypothetical protein HMPREF1868_00775 [Olsenella sp. DNF00959]
MFERLAEPHRASPASDGDGAGMPAAFCRGHGGGPSATGS